ncbi:MAG: DUF6252 family protein [Flavobacteriaceae bacterium]|nr:DUF6252 family protein [Flavobacteriaceae bacterium]
MTKFLHKSVLLYLLASLFFFACEDDIEDNSGAFQATVQGVFWKANQATASVLDDGSLVIIGADNDQRLILRTQSFLPNRYLFSSSLSNNATFETFSGNTQATTRPFQSAGEIFIEKVNPDKGSITGTFHYRTRETFSGDDFFIREGIFYEIPIVNFDPGLLDPIDPDIPPDDDDDPDDDGASFENHFFARVNGNPFPPQIITVSVNNGIISVTNAVPPSMAPAMTIRFSETIGPGSFAIGASGNNAAFYTPGGIDLNATSGTLIIDSHNTAGREVRGRFNFRVAQQGNPVEVTEGEFAIRY